MTTPASRHVDDSADRRETPRRRKQLKVHVSDAEAEAKPSTGWVSDRSIGGLSLLFGEEQQIGKVLSVRPTVGNVPWVQVEVLSCRQVENDWLLGCRFVRQPSYSVLLQFG